MIMSVALQCGATGIIMMHNHPSGNLQPSIADKNMTKKLADCCKILDMTLLDSIIINPDYQYYSFADNGEI